jgi:hypothetical protein
MIGARIAEIRICKNGMGPAFPQELASVVSRGPGIWFFMGWAGKKLLDNLNDG